MAMGWSNTLHELGVRERVYTGGTFDTFHAGHVFLLEQGDKLGDVVVALNTDEFVERYKGKKPVVSYDERKAVLESCRYVSEVIPNDQGEDSKPTILSVKPSFLIIGEDWAKKDYYSQMSFTQEWLNEQGITMFYVPHYPNLSSTEIKRRVRED